MRNGLVNASGTKFQVNGKAYGDGIYISPSVCYYHNRNQCYTKQPTKTPLKRYNTNNTNTHRTTLPTTPPKPPKTTTLTTTTTPLTTSINTNLNANKFWTITIPSLSTPMLTSLVQAATSFGYCKINNYGYGFNTVQYKEDDTLNTAVDPSTLTCIAICEGKGHPLDFFCFPETPWAHEFFFSLSYLVRSMTYEISCKQGYQEGHKWYLGTATYQLCDDKILHGVFTRRCF